MVPQIPVGYDSPRSVSSQRMLRTPRSRTPRSVSTPRPNITPHTPRYRSPHTPLRTPFNSSPCTPSHISPYSPTDSPIAAFSPYSPHGSRRRRRRIIENDYVEEETPSKSNPYDDVTKGSHSYRNSLPRSIQKNIGE